IALTRAPLTPWAGQPERTGRAEQAGQADRPDQSGGAPERWLDMCAGPGGKARLLYGLASLPREAGPGSQGTLDRTRAAPALLTAAELHPPRAALVREALPTVSRTVTGEPPAFEVIVADATRPPWPG